jgi:hypothetical protein
LIDKEVGFILRTDNVIIAGTAIKIGFKGMELGRGQGEKVSSF